MVNPEDERHTGVMPWDNNCLHPANVTIGQEGAKGNSTLLQSPTGPALFAVDSQKKLLVTSPWQTGICRHHRASARKTGAARGQLANHDICRRCNS